MSAAAHKGRPPAKKPTQHEGSLPDTQRPDEEVLRLALFTEGEWKGFGWTQIEPSSVVTAFLRRDDWEDGWDRVWARFDECQRDLDALTDYAVARYATAPRRVVTATTPTGLSEAVKALNGTRDPHAEAPELTPELDSASASAGDTGKTSEELTPDDLVRHGIPCDAMTREEHERLVRRMAALGWSGLAYVEEFITVIGWRPGDATAYSVEDKERWAAHVAEQERRAAAAYNTSQAGAYRLEDLFEDTAKGRH